MVKGSRAMGGRVSSQLRIFLTEPGKARRLVWSGHNTVGANLIGYLHYWSAHDATSKPIAYIGITHGSGTVYEETDNDGPTAYGSPVTGYSVLATAEWTNNTGASKTVSALGLHDTNDTTVMLTYATETGLSQAVGVGAKLTVEWTILLEQADTNVATAFMARMCNRLIEAQSTCPVKTAKFTADNADYDSVAVGDPTSGGTVTSTNVVWTVTGTAPTGAATLAAMTLFDGEPLQVETTTGLTEPWVDGDTITDTITLTWAEAA